MCPNEPVGQALASHASEASMNRHMGCPRRRRFPSAGLRGWREGGKDISDISGRLLQSLARLPGTCERLQQAVHGPDRSTQTGRDG